MTRYIEKAVSDLRNILEKLDISKIEEIKKEILDAKKNNKTIYVIGNGGSSSVATHFAADLTKTSNNKIKAISLVDNIPLITAISNDISFDDIFKYQIDIFGEKGDVLIIFSVHGGDYRSGNLVNAARLAKNKGMKTIAIVGFDGGHLKNICDIVLNVGAYDTGLVESLFSIVTHLITFEIRCEHGDISR